MIAVFYLGRRLYLILNSKTPPPTCISHMLQNSVSWRYFEKLLGECRIDGPIEDGKETIGRICGESKISLHMVVFVCVCLAPEMILIPL